MALSPLDTQTAPCDTWHRSFHPDGNSHSFHPDVSHSKFCPANVLPYPNVSHPESFSAAISPGVSLPESCSAAIPPRCLIPGILLRHHSIRMSHIRNPFLPPFHLGVSFPESFSAAIPPSVSHPEFLSADVPPSPNVSHPKFYPTDVSPFSSSLKHFL